MQVDQNIESHSILNKTHLIFNWYFRIKSFQWSDKWTSYKSRIWNGSHIFLLSSSKTIHSKTYWNLWCLNLHGKVVVIAFEQTPATIHSEKFLWKLLFLLSKLIAMRKTMKFIWCYKIYKFFLLPFQNVLS